MGLWSYLAPVRTEPIAAPTEEKMAELQAEYLRRFGRLPSNEEKHALWMDAVQQEVLFREGIALGLDAGDPIVKRRVVQKMGFMLAYCDNDGSKNRAFEAQASYAMEFKSPEDEENG